MFTVICALVLGYFCVGLLGCAAVTYKGKPYLPLSHYLLCLFLWPLILV